LYFKTVHIHLRRACKLVHNLIAVTVNNICSYIINTYDLHTTLVLTNILDTDIAYKIR